MRSADRRKVNVLEMKCLRSLVGVLRMDRVRNEEVRRRACIEMELASRADERELRWFGHVERMTEYRIIIGIIIKKSRQCKAESEWYTPYQSEDPNPTIPTYRQKEEKGKTSRRL